MTTFAPRHCDIWPWTATYSEVGTWARTNDTGMLGMGYKNNNTSHAQNDEVVYHVALDSGTWTLTAIVQTRSSGGIAAAYLDATSLGTIDTYSASIVPNVVKQIAGFTVATPAVYALKFKVESKNPSASEYRFNHQLVTLTRTGA